MTADTSSGAWYAESGAENDVVISTRIRIARNLLNFPFPVAIKSDDAEAVQSLIFDSFNHLEHPEQYQMVRMSNIDPLGRKILAERGVIRPESGIEPWRAVVIRGDGALSATVNVDDHLRLAAFRPGLDFSWCRQTLETIDSALQEQLQFASAADFGYLCQDLTSAGTGMKASVLLSLSGLVMTSLAERVIRESLSQGFLIRGYYTSGNNDSLGALYQICNASGANGDMESQIESLEMMVRRIIEMERRSREELLNTQPTSIEDIVYRAVVTARYARFIPVREGVELISRIKLGLHLGLVSGISDSALTALLYRIQNAHLGFVILGGSIIIEEDIKTEEMRIERLRAMIIQEVLKEVDIKERR